MNLVRQCALLLGLLVIVSSALAQQVCVPQVLSVQAAPAAEQLANQRISAWQPIPTRPVDGWINVALPDDWSTRWPQQRLGVWYRLDWQLACISGHSDQDVPVALGIDGISMAGAVYSNDSLLWRDTSLVEPLSRSWNMPRWWILPQDSLRDGINTVWVYVAGVVELSPGLGRTRVDFADQVQAIQESHWWRQRTVYMLTAGMAAAVGGLFLVIWLLRRSERVFGWYALASLSWAGYLTTLLLTSSWPWSNALALSRLNIALFVVYIVALCMFIWRFAACRFPRLERWLWGLAVLAIGGVVLIPSAAVPVVFAIVWYGAIALFFISALQYQWLIWWRKRHDRSRAQKLMALCLLLILVVAVHDTLLVLQMWAHQSSWNPVVGPLATLLMALLVGCRLAAGMQRIERFNQELESRVQEARQELSLALGQAHLTALDNAKLQERMKIAHDLHDGIGASLVRSMALVEQSYENLSKDRVLSLFSILRDDLRQVIDQGSSAGVVIPDTPVRWVAPLRHRFTRILDELGVKSTWRVEDQWQQPYRPSALQCLGLARLIEEALSNVIKHSRARHLRVTVRSDGDMQQPVVLVLLIEDDGIGFDVAAVREAGVSVGMRSMSARAERIGARFSVQSGLSGTVVTVVTPLQQNQVQSFSPPAGTMLQPPSTDQGVALH
ncbi:histidine kinase [Lampropedia puyangensis]|uniref:Histidine kinase n=1 Tax=Lampropedia puyangensis TaxID=1330072 RepID=A0A4S8FDM4_9BURK|nr:7TM diverse intracellular signaling domain-containing protein [Lampropedia puyangensis]THU05369.1 histidine kinase [Lampropedia puyangensis]